MAALQNIREQRIAALVNRTLVGFLSLSANSSSFIRQKNTVTATPASITVTASVNSVYTAAAAYRWERSTDIDPNTWTTSGLGTSTSQLITNTNFETWVGLGAQLRLRCTVTQSYRATVSSVYSIDYIKEGNDGASGTSGSNAILADLLSESDIVSAANDGTNYSAIPSNSLRLYSGGTLLTTGVTYTVSAPTTVSGLTAAINASGTISFTGTWTSDTASFTFNGITSGNTYSAVYSVAKSKQGASGTSGSNAVLADLLSESDIVASANDGTGYGAFPSNSLRLYSGGAQVTTGVTYNVSNPTTVSGLTAAINASGVITLTGSTPAWTSDTASFTFNAVTSGTTYSAVYSIAKSKQGAPGAAGNNAILVDLLSESDILSANNDGTNYGAFPANSLRLYSGGTQLTSGITYNVSPPNVVSGLTATINASGAITLSGSTPAWTSDTASFTFNAITSGTTYSAVYSIAKSKQGAAGSGANAVLVDLTAENHVVSAATDGTGYGTLPGNSLKLYSGGTQVTTGVVYSVSPPTTVSGLTAAIDSTGTITLSGASWTSDTANFIFNGITGGNTYSSAYSIAKSKQGTAGNPGTNGTNGGVAVFAYAITSSATLPTAPTIPQGTIPTAASAISSASAANWYTTPASSLSAGQWMFQVGGVRNDNGTFTWTNPSYLSTFRVGTLSALGVSTGALTVDNTLTLGSSGKIQTNNNTGFNTTGIFLGDDAGTYKFSVGTPGSILSWNGSTLTVPAGTLSGTIPGTVTPPGGWLNSNIFIDGSGLIQGISAAVAVANSAISVALNGQITGIGTGNNTVVANTAISISALGAIQGIGTGNNIVVANTAISIDANGLIQGISAAVAVANSAIAVNTSGQITGIGTGVNTVVANTAISISGTGAIQGIGTGINTVVANTAISVNSSGQLLGIGTGVNTVVANTAISISGTGAIQGIGTGAGVIVANTAISIDANGLIQGISAAVAVANSAIAVNTSGQITGIGTGANTVVANTAISVNSSGQLLGIGTGANTVVANTAISVVSGAIQGIGSGAGTTVANSLITIGELNGVISLGNAGSGSVTTITANNKITPVNVNTYIGDTAISANYIAANAITAGKIAAGAITTEKLLVTGSGASITPDPNTQDFSAWVGAAGAGGTIIQDTASPTGYALRLTLSNTVYTQLTPLDEAKNYLARFSIRQESGTSTTYGTIAFYDGAGALLEGSSFPTGWSSFGTFHYFGLAAQTAPSTWTEYRISFGPNETAKIPPGTKFVRIGILANYALGPGVQRLTNVRITEKANADLIVDGSIVAGKIAANAVVAGNIAAGAVTAGALAANAVLAGNIAAGAVTANNISADTITASKIVISGAGSALNEDPLFQDPAITTTYPAYDIVRSGTYSRVTLTDGRAGDLAIRMSTTSSADWIAIRSRYFQIAAGKTYRVSLWIRRTSGSPRTYVRLHLLNQSKTTLSPDEYVLTQKAPNTSGNLEDFIPSTTWTRYIGIISSSNVNAAHAFIELYGVFASVGEVEVQDLRCEEVIDSSLIVDGAIIAGKIAAGAVTAGSLAANAVVAGNIAAGAVTAGAIAANAVLAGNIAAGAVTAGAIAANAVVAGNIAAGAVTAGAIAANAVLAGNIAAGAVTAGAIAANAVVAGNIAAGSVSASAIAANAVIAGKIAAGAVTAGAIAANAVLAGNIAAGAVTAGAIAANAVLAGNIAAGAVTAGAIAANAVLAGNIAANAITANNIQAGAITASKLVLTNSDNIIPDPGFSDFEWWGFGTDNNFVATDQAGVTAAPTRYCTINGGMVVGRDYFGANIPVEQGASYRFRLRVFIAAGTTGDFRPSFHLPNQYYFSPAAANNDGSGLNLIGFVPTNTWTTYTKIFTVNPAGTTGNNWIEPRTTANITAGNVRFAWEITRAADADLIVDGAITATKLTVTSLSAVSGTMGALTVDNTLSLGTNGVIKTTGINYNGNGIFLGRESGNNRFSVGDGTNNLSFDGTTLTVPAARMVGIIPTTVTAPSGWVNSNITINSSTGTISGIGTGDGQSVANNEDNIIRAPVGAVSVNNASSVTGAVKIRLPQSWTNTMMRFTVEIYEYIDNFMCTLEIGGYNYAPSTQWYNVSARVVGSSNVEYPVYFGHDGTRCCVWIGLNGETWSYPQVRVRDFFAGHSNGTRSLWETGWSITFDTTALTVGTGTNQYSASVIDTLPGARWQKSSGRPTNLANLSGTEAIQNTQITIGTDGRMSGIGTGDGTSVDNRKLPIANVNLISDPHNFSAWNYNNATLNVATGLGDFNGGTLAARVTLSATPWDMYRAIGGLKAGGTYRVSLYVLRETASNFCITLNNGSTWNTGETVVVTGSGWQRAEAKITTDTGTINIHLGAHSNSTLGETQQTAGTVLLSYLQVEETTAYENNTSFTIARPQGGLYTTTTDALTGRIKIRLPARVNVHAPMVKFTVDIYEYIAGYSCTMLIGGHLSGTTWYNEYANVIGGNTEYEVRFGHDGTYAAVWIGNSNAESWSYPQVLVKDVFVGYVSTNGYIWDKNWQITFENSGGSNITRTVSDTYPGANWVKVSGAAKPADYATSDLKLNVRGTGLVLKGNSCDRPTGGGNWDADCYSTEGYTGGAFCSFIPSAGTSSYFMAGLNADPLTNQVYNTLDYCFYMYGGSDLRIYESDVDRGSFGTYVAGDVLSVTYDGVNVRYLQNGNVLRTVAASPNLKLYFDSSIVLHGLSNIKFGPMTSNNWADTGGTGKPQDNANNTFIDSSGTLQGISQNAGTTVDNKKVSGVNMLWGTYNGPFTAGPGAYGTGVLTLKSGTNNPYGIKAGEQFTVSADIWQDSVSAAANQNCTMYFYTYDSGGNWTGGSVAFSTTSQTPTRGSATSTIPAAEANFWGVAVAFYHQGGTSGQTAGSVFADRVQVERGTVATQYSPGYQPGANQTFIDSNGLIQGVSQNAGVSVRNDLITISSNGTLSGAGGGTVTIAGMDNTVVRSVNPITTSNVTTYIGNSAISTNQISANAITADKISVTSLSAVSGNMGSLTVDNTLSLGTAGVIKTSGINYGGDGIFLGRESGTNKFSVGTGSAKLTFDGSTLTVPAANLTGTAAANTIATTSISAGAATAVYSGSSTGSSITISISVPSSAAGLSVLAYSGNPYTQSDGKGGVYTVIPDANIIVNGTTQVSQNGTAVWNTATPTTGTYNVVTTRAAGLTGTMWCQIIVAKR